MYYVDFKARKLIDKIDSDDLDAAIKCLHKQKLEIEANLTQNLNDVEILSEQIERHEFYLSQIFNPIVNKEQKAG